MAPIRRYWSQPTSENREAIRKGLILGGMRREYSSGIPNPEVIAPEGYTLDAALMAHEKLNFHPLVNTATTTISRGGLLKFLAATGHSARIEVLAAAEKPRLHLRDFLPI